jgi:hypothetical protein
MLNNIVTSQCVRRAGRLHYAARNLDRHHYSIIQSLNRFVIINYHKCQLDKTGKW